MDDKPIQPGYVLLVTTLSSFLTPFMASAIDLSVPAIGASLHADALALTRMASIYLVVSAALLLPFGRAADLYGRRRFYLAGLVVYTAASVLAATAGSIQALIAFRLLQGVGGAMVFGTATAILTSSFPPDQRGRVLGINTAATYTGLSLGPSLGGIMTRYLGWRSIFFLAAAVALVALLMALWKLRYKDQVGPDSRRFDWVGAVLYAGSLLALLDGISSVGEAISGNLAALTAPVVLAVLGAIGLVAFFIVETRATAHDSNPGDGVRIVGSGGQPLLNLGRFRHNTPFIFSNLAALIHYSATFAIGFVLSLYLQIAKGLPTDQAGLILLVQPVMMATLSPVTGWLSDRIQPRVLASAGMAMMAVGLLFLSLLVAGSPIALLLGILFLIGLGYALFSSPNTNAVMSSVARSDYGLASSTLGTMRLTGQALSLTIVLLFFALYIGPVQVTPAVAPSLLVAERVIFEVFTVLCVLGMIASLARGDVKREA